MKSIFDPKIAILAFSPAWPNLAQNGPSPEARQALVGQNHAKTCCYHSFRGSGTIWDHLGPSGTKSIFDPKIAILTLASPAHSPQGRWWAKTVQKHDFPTHLEVVAPFGTILDLWDEVNF